MRTECQSIAMGEKMNYYSRYPLHINSLKLDIPKYKKMIKWDKT